jgi:Fe2+ or Zn2+ uptake regulation protein
MAYEDIKGPVPDGEDEVEGLDRFVSTLRAHDIKVTSQRIRILKFLDRFGDHVDADAIYSALKGHNPSLSKTTVYNTLDLFHEKGLVSVLTISGTEQRYELEQGMHHHLLCSRCGGIYNIDISCPYLGGMIHGEHKIEEVHGYFRGICKNCLSAAAVKENRED